MTARTDPGAQWWGIDEERIEMAKDRKVRGGIRVSFVEGKVERRIEVDNDPIDGFKLRLTRAGDRCCDVALTFQEAMAVQSCLWEVLGRPRPGNPDEGLRKPIDVRDFVASLATMGGK